jgi:hypothetical protein
VCAQKHYQSAQPSLHALAVEGIAMLPLERERLANQLAAYVVNVTALSKDADKHLWSCRILGMALTLHPQNPRARRTDTHLARGLELKPIAMDLETSVLAKFLYQRAQQLLKAENAEVSENAVVARYLIALSAQVDPYFEEAVYAHELHRIDGLAPDWQQITGRKTSENTGTRD